MKKAILFLAVSIFSLSAISQATTSKNCTATTKSGNACKGKPVKNSSTCFVHVPGPKCGAQTKAGKPCEMKVKAAGLKCHHHSSK